MFLIALSTQGPRILDPTCRSLLRKAQININVIMSVHETPATNLKGIIEGDEQLK